MSFLTRPRVSLGSIPFCRESPSTSPISRVDTHSLSWIGALACAGTVALLLHRKGLISSALAVVAVPLIANRTQPRAEMFTTVLFAAFLSLLWRHYRNGRSAVWLLPILMVLWVNLHLGFVAGLAICAAYVVLESSRSALSNQTADRTRSTCKVRGHGWR